MAKIRLQRVAAQMKHVVSRVVTQELKDPRCGFVTIVDVEVAPDLKSARVRFSVLGSDAQKRTAQRALDSARGYVQSRLAGETDFKYIPVITFHLDESAEREIDFFRKIDETVKTDRRVQTARLIRQRVAAGSIPADVVAEVSRAAGSAEFVESVAALLIDLMAADTTPRSDAPSAAAAERKCLDIIETALKQTWADEVTTEFLPVAPEIEGHAAYTPPHYMASADDAPPSAEQAYEGRGNLVAVLRRADLQEPPAPDSEEQDNPEEQHLEPLRLALNAHIDTVPPHIPPSRKGDVVWGRGACDAKGAAAMVVAAFRLLRHLRDRLGVKVCQDLCAQFVIDEETGGNGSLSLALEDPFMFTGIVICESTDFQVYTANRGALWYRAELRPPPGRAAELAACFILALEEEGQAIKAESDHPLFPTRPVQTNHGIIGPFGSAPSAVNDLVELEITSQQLDEAQIERAAAHGAAHGVDKYCAAYGDKARETDPDTGQPKVARHFSLESRAGAALLLSVHGKGGHMGSLDRCDNAVTKAAYIIRELTELQKSGEDLNIALHGHEGPALVLEGGQGFLPTHTTEQIASRLAAAGERAAEACHGAEVKMTFDKLHNTAFAREPDSALAVYAAESRKRAGLDIPPHPAGWETSCDARLFADAFHDRDLIVFGPGRLRHAHSPDEQISLREIAAGAKMLTYLVLECSGFVV